MLAFPHGMDVVQGGPHRVTSLQVASGIWATQTLHKRRA